MLYMKTTRCIIKLFCPMGLFVLWVEWRYPKLELPEEAAIRGTLKCIWWIVPYGVFCVNAQVTAEDRRPLKYWVPYGRMCRSVAERYGYVVNRGTIEDVHDFANGYQRTQKNESAFSPIVRWVRRWSPYGLILWWDRTDAAGSIKPLPTKANAPAQKSMSNADARALSRQIQQLDERVRKLENLIAVKSDNLEIQLLKLRLAVKELAKG